MSVRSAICAQSDQVSAHQRGADDACSNWLYARHTGRTFVLRIEDTDSARNTTEATEVILEGLRWLGLDWDEGPAAPDPAIAGRGHICRPADFQSQRGETFTSAECKSLQDKRGAGLRERGGDPISNGTRAGGDPRFDRRRRDASIDRP